MVALGHFHLYTSCKFAKKMVATAQEKPMPHEVLLKDAAPRIVDISKWKQWKGVFEAGEYWTFNIEDAREEFLKTKRIPKAILKGLHDAKRLVIHACAADEFKGTIYIHQLNEDWGNLKEWCEALREKEGIDITYQGEGLPSLSRKVML